MRHITSFLIDQPVDMVKTSGLMWQDVPNRGRVFPFAPRERAFGDVMLASGSQGDNSGATVVRPTASVNGLRCRFRQLSSTLGGFNPGPLRFHQSRTT